MGLKSQIGEALIYGPGRVMGRIKSIASGIKSIPGRARGLIGSAKNWAGVGRASTLAEKLYTAPLVGATAALGGTSMAAGIAGGGIAAGAVAGAYAVGVPALSALNKAAYAATVAPAAMIGAPLLHAATTVSKGLFAGAKGIGSAGARGFMNAQRINFGSSKLAAASLTYAGIGVGGYVGLRAAGNVMNSSLKDRYQDNTMGLSQSLHRAYR